MSWRKGNVVVNSTDPGEITKDLEKLSIESSLSSQTEKFLILNLLQRLQETQMIDEEHFRLCKEQIQSSSRFDARNIMSYAPPHWSKLQDNIPTKPRDNFPSNTVASCILLIHDLCAYVKLPWRTVITAAIVFQRYCYTASTEENKLKRESSFLKTQSYSGRVILVTASLLLATKVEESLCKIGCILDALQSILGRENYIAAIPESTRKRSRGVHLDEEEAMAWPLRIHEAIILEILGFDIEVEHPHYYVQLLFSLPFSKVEIPPEVSDNILLKAYSLLDKCVLGTKNPLPLFSSPPLVALSAIFLAWFYYRQSEEDTFNWNILILNTQNVEELKATIQFMMCIFSEQEALRVKNWESAVPPSEGMKFYHEFKAKTCRPLDTIIRDQVICEGAYGTVWVAQDRATGETVALKQLKNTLGRNGFPYYMLREILFLRRLKHPNVVSGSDVVSKHVPDGTREFYIVMEYYSFDMRDIWLAQKDFTASPLWTEANIKHLTLQLLDAISYMHRRGLMHRDIKLENLLFDSGVLKVADLGSIRDAGRTALKLTTAVVTLWYRPPELLLGNNNYTSAIDIWSIGCVIVELLSMKALFPGRDVEDMMYRIASCLGAPSESVWDEQFRHLPSARNIKAIVTKAGSTPTHTLESVLNNRSPACLDLIHRMICYDPNKRITAEEALHHPYFREAPLPEKYCPKQ